MLSDDEVDRLYAMDDETFDRQTAIESFRQLRSLNAIANVDGQFFRDFAELLARGDDFGLLEDLPGMDDLQKRATEAAEAINRLRATVAKFCEIGETEIDTTGLVEVPEQAAFDAIDRSREFRRILESRREDS